MRRLTSILGHTGAVLTIVCAVLTPFLLAGFFQKMVARTGVRVDDSFTGGRESHAIQRDCYRIVVNHPVPRRSPLQRTEAFVQLAWTPAAALPAHVSDAVDLNGDGTPDVVVSFDASRSRSAALSVDAQPLTGMVRPLRHCSQDSFSALIVRVKDGIVVRLPLVRDR
jgi:hypothetical protein